MKYAVLGAGLTGLTIAKLLSNKHDVTIFEHKNEVGGMCYEVNDGRVTYSKYGPHIFHTNDITIWQFVNKYCKMIPYYHSVKALTDAGILNWPINYRTLKSVFGGKNKTEVLGGWHDSIEKAKVKYAKEDNFESVALHSIGEELYNLFIKTYTTTQWQTNPKFLPSELFGRIRMEFSNKANFFNDTFVALPKNGFNELCFNLAKGIKIINKEITSSDLEYLQQNYDVIISTIPPWTLLNEKPVDMIKINFVEANNDSKEIIDIMRKEKLSVLNLCNNKKYTRMTNYGMLYKNINVRDKFILEEPGDSGIPLYPIRIESNLDRVDNMLIRLQQKGIYSIGRLGCYKYINMDQAIKQAMDLYIELEGEI